MPEVETIKVTRSKNIDPQKQDQHVISPNDAADFWEVFEINIYSPDVPNSSTGEHEFVLRGETPDEIPEYLYLQNVHDENIWVHRSTIKSAQTTEPKTEELLCRSIRSIRIDKSTGLECVYYNYTDETQTDPRKINLRVIVH